MPTHLFKKARQNTRYIRHFEYNNIRDTVEKQVGSKLRQYPKWMSAMSRFPPSALLAKAPSHYIERNHPSSFPFSIMYPTPTGKHKRDTFKRKMIPPPLYFDNGLDFKLSTDFPFELAKPQFLSNTEDELKKDSTLQKHFEELKLTKSPVEAYDDIVEIFKKRQLESCGNLYSTFEKIELQGRKEFDLLEKEITEPNNDEMSDDDKLKIKMLLLMKKKHAQLVKNKMESNEDPFIDIRDSKPSTYKLLHKERIAMEEHQKLEGFRSGNRGR